MNEEHLDNLVNEYAGKIYFTVTNLGAFAIQDLAECVVGDLDDLSLQELFAFEQALTLAVESMGLGETRVQSKSILYASPEDLRELVETL